MLIQRTKPIERSLRAELLQTREVSYMDFGKIFTPDTAKTYLMRLLEWIEQNAWDAETYFIDHNRVCAKFDGYAPVATETYCTAMLRSADDAIEEAIHTLSDLCGKSWSYTFSWDEYKTQYAPMVAEIIGMVQEQVTLLNKFTENPRYDEIYRRYAGHAGPWHVQGDDDYDDRSVVAAGDPLVDALDGIFDQACNLLERLGPNFPPVYTCQYPLFSGSTLLPDSYKILTDTDDRQSIGFLKDGEYIINPSEPDDSFRVICPGDKFIMSEMGVQDQESDVEYDLFGDWTKSVNIITPAYAIAVQEDGKVLLGGYFPSTTDYIIRLNVDGTRDTSFDPPAAIDDVVHDIKIDANGDILVGGEFTGYLMRLSGVDGSEDTAFTPSLNDDVNAIAIQDDGKILVGGQFTSHSGYLARLETADGSNDAAFTPALNSHVYSIAIQDDGKILVGGQFTSHSGYLARLETADGSNDAMFTPSLNSSVRVIKLLADGRIIVGGDFTNHLTRLETVDGSVDDTFSPVTLSANVYSIALLLYGEMFIGGGFTGYYKRLANDGSEMPTVTAGDAVEGTDFGDFWFRKIRGAA